MLYSQIEFFFSSTNSQIEIETNKLQIYRFPIERLCVLVYFSSCVIILNIYSYMKRKDIFIKKKSKFLDFKTFKITHFLI
jgi:hypothetical protein